MRCGSYGGECAINNAPVDIRASLIAEVKRIKDSADTMPTEDMRASDLCDTSIFTRTEVDMIDTCLNCQNIGRVSLINRTEIVYK
jgi:hypothetical protein